MNVFKSSSKSLFLICPTWNLENKIRVKHGLNAYFLTALGGIFHIDAQTAEHIKCFIRKNRINKINIVINPSCKFIQNVLNPKEFNNTKAEQLLTEIYHTNYSSIEEENKTHFEKCNLLSTERALMQLKQLMKLDFIKEKVQNKELDICLLSIHKQPKVNQ
ncbi:MAG: hypothetical protein RQ756_05320 [Flavobacteriaceae bacterium]|nr:hypothetical protein [Flavobacteriaceae bacterium]